MKKLTSRVIRTFCNTLLRTLIFKCYRRNDGENSRNSGAGSDQTDAILLVMIMATTSSQFA